MLRRVTWRLCRRPPTTSRSHWRQQQSRPTQAPPASQSRSQPSHALRQKAPVGATPAAARLAERLQGLEAVGNNAPFDLQRHSEDAVDGREVSRADTVTDPAFPRRRGTEAAHLRRAHDAQGSTPAARLHAAPSSTRRPRRSVETLMRERAREPATQAQDLAVFAEDDVIMNVPLSLRHLSAAAASVSDSPATASAVGELKAHASKHKMTRSEDTREPLASSSRDVEWHPSARGIGQDVVDLVTDAFREQREAEIAKRRKVLYDLTHPNPVDYTFNGKLVPPPPLNFGRVTEEAIQLGHQLIAEQPYSLVRKAGTRADAEAEHIPTSEPNTANMLEGGEGTGASSRTARKHVGARANSRASQAHRGRKREENIFRDHNFFFEINELYQEIVLVGKACAGKSSLLNALLEQKVAKTSSTPNTTRQISFYQSVTPEALRDFHARERHNNLVKLPGGGRQLTFVDMPGFGIEGMSEKWRDAAIELTDAYFGVRRSVNTVLFCIDCERGLTAGDVKYFEWLENVQGVFYIVLTKCDAVSHTRLCAVMRQIYELITRKRRKFRKVFPFIIPTSAKTGLNMDVLRGLVTETSGILPGDKLRDLLQHKKEVTTQLALENESQRLLAVRAEERKEAKRLFLQTHHAAQLGGSDAATRASQLTAALQDSPDNGASAHIAPENANDDGDHDDDVFVPLDGMPDEPSPSGVSLFIGNPRNAHTTRRLVGDKGQSSRKHPHEAPASAGNDSSGASDSVGEGGAAQSSRDAFLSWRQQNPLEYQETPYGKVRFRLNTGLDNPLSEILKMEPHETASADSSPSAEGADVPDAALPAARVQTPVSAVIGLDGTLSSDAMPPPQPSSSVSSITSASATGAVSRYLDVMTAYATQPHELRGRRAAREREASWRRHYAPRFLAEDGEGRLSEYTAGRKTGPSLVSATTRVEQRKAAWKARQLQTLLQTESPDTPWSSLPRLTQKINALKEEANVTGRRMRKKDVAAYLKTAGSVTESFEKFEGEVTAAAYMNEVRQAKTMRSQQQMHLNATAKINYRSMPPGLWKAYGKKDTHWPTPRVLGRDQDESHGRK